MQCLSNAFLPFDELGSSGLINCEESETGDFWTEGYEVGFQARWLGSLRTFLRDRGVGFRLLWLIAGSRTSKALSGFLRFVRCGTGITLRPGAACASACFGEKGNVGRTDCLNGGELNSLPRVESRFVN